MKLLPFDLKKQSAYSLLETLVTIFIVSVYLSIFINQYLSATYLSRQIDLRRRVNDAVVSAYNTFQDSDILNLSTKNVSTITDSSYTSAMLNFRYNSGLNQFESSTELDIYTKATCQGLNATNKDINMRPSDTVYPTCLRYKIRKIPGTRSLYCIHIEGSGFAAINKVTFTGFMGNTAVKSATSDNYKYDLTIVKSFKENLIENTGLIDPNSTNNIVSDCNF